MTDKTIKVKTIDWYPEDHVEFEFDMQYNAFKLDETQKIIDVSKEIESKKDDIKETEGAIKLASVAFKWTYEEIKEKMLVVPMWELEKINSAIMEKAGFWDINIDGKKKGIV